LPILINIKKSLLILNELTLEQKETR